ncbi:MAG: RidA family protein [Patescibacteria group bacterium]|nr:RidA family protein [Patescibacteria group bacterium]
MSKQIISTDKAPKAIGPYSQAIQAGGFIFCSGQISLKPDGNFIDKNIKEQTKQVMDNLNNILKSVDLDLSDVIKTTIYLTDLSDFQTVNKIYSNYFKQNPPARSTVQVLALPKEAKIEIECVAVDKK